VLGHQLRLHLDSLGEAGLQELAQCPPDVHVQDLAPWLHDFGDTALLLAQLDLIITVDTAVAHLAGALGTPVWVLLPAVPDWRWGLAGEQTPWYPTMQLFRQARAGDWTAVMPRVAQALPSPTPSGTITLRGYL
jgi:ADP-heptose:LPS heptosyltransferase